MTIAILKEISPGETRVAATPEIVRQYVKMGQNVQIEQSVGAAAGFADSEYLAAGAKLHTSAAATLKGASIIAKIWAPLPSEDQLFEPGQTIVANFQSQTNPERIHALATRQISGFALELIPRTARAQSMDILSSQSNLAGYKAVMEAFNLLPKSAPLLMTAAGTLAPAKVLVLGAGVAGLQAIATAKRLGAQVWAADVRPGVKEQVESLGGKFIEVSATENLQTAGGYAKTATAAYANRQKQAVLEHLPQTDIIITTALVPGAKAPRLVDSAMLKSMRPGSVIVDMAAAAGGNVEGSQEGKLVNINGVKILGNSNLAAQIPHSASLLYAQNIYNFLRAQYNEELKEFRFNFADDIISQTCVINTGRVLLPKEQK